MHRKIRTPEARGTWVVALSIAALAMAAAIARVVLVGHGSLGFLVGAGRTYSDPTRLPAGVPVRVGPGYDGQFMYRLAHHPFDWHEQSSGVRLDGVFRLGRIGYPLLVWIVSIGGTPALLPAGLLLVGVASLVALGVVGAWQARAYGLAPAWGLLVCWPGLLFSIDFDLAEPLEVALVIAGLLAVRASRPGLAAVALSAAVLTRETALVAVVAVAACRLPIVWRQRRPAGPDLAWMVPVAVFVTWQCVCRTVTGTFPLTSDASSNAQPPFAGIVQAWTRWMDIARLHAGAAWLHAVELVVMVAVVGAALIAARRRGSPPAPETTPIGGQVGVTDPLLVATAFGVLAAIFASVAVWASGSDLRMFADTYAVASLVLLRLAPKRALVGWALTAAALTVAIGLYRALVV